MPENPRSTEETARATVVCVSSNASLRTLLCSCVERSGLPTQAIPCADISEVYAHTTSQVDVLVIDVTVPGALAHIPKHQVAGLVHRTRTIALCAPAQAAMCGRLVMREQFYDYFVLTPEWDVAYLRVQIWRAIMSLRPAPPAHAQSPLASLPPAHAEAIAPYLGKTALIVDSDPVASAILRDFLQPEGFEVKLVRSVLLAYRRYANAAPPDIILMEPYSSSLSVGRSLSILQTQFKNVPLIVTSTQATRQIVSECAKASVAGFLVKPIRRHVLLERLSLAIPRRMP